MSRSIYIRSQKKYKDYVEFLDIWKNKLGPEIRSKLVDTCDKLGVSKGFEQIVVDQVDDFLHKKFVYEDYYEERLGQFLSKDFEFDFLILEGVSIWNKKILKKFLEDYPDYVLINEYDEVVSYEEAFEKAK